MAQAKIEADGRIAELEAACAEAIDWYPSDGAPPYMQYIREVMKCAAPVADSAMAKDAEAFRQMVMHRLLVGIHLDESWAQSYGTPEGEWLTIKEKNGDDAYAAARRAIDRAVAAIAASAEKGDKA